MKFRLAIFRSALAAVFLTGFISLTGCAKHGTHTATFGSGEDILPYGVYSAQTQDTHGFASKLSLNQNYTYSRKKFQGTCLLVENKGEWKSDHESLEFHLLEVRKRTDCNSEDWQVEKTDKTTVRLLRNVTTTSFDLLDQEEDVAAQWVRFVKR